jgi:membrane protein implicated in regulation of membrane protease activity
VKPVSNWDIFQGIAAVASIVGLIALLVGGLPALWQVLLAVLLIVTVALVVVASIQARKPQVRTTKREEMIEKGKEIISGTMSTLVMFGGDMSWAGDYSPAIKAITDAGKKVVVVYPESKAHNVKGNAELLEKNGAVLKPIEKDTSLRGFLVDPDSNDGGRFWLARRRLKKQGKSSPPGVAGGGDYEYVTQEFRASEDPIVIEALLTVYRVVS